MMKIGLSKAKALKLPYIESPKQNDKFCFVREIVKQSVKIALQDSKEA